MKNAIISILATKILMDGSFWEFNGFEDRAIVTVMVCLVLFTLLQCFESFYKDVRREAIRRRRSTGVSRSAKAFSSCWTVAEAAAEPSFRLAP